MAVLMVSTRKQFATPTFSTDILIIVGGYGSGKSEVAVNLARYLAENFSDNVSIADLDIVNPYFRSREAEEALKAINVTSLIPRGSYKYADLPILIPDVKGAIEQHAGKVVLDVGGDDVGARILSSLADAFEAGKYELLLVLNKNRPFTGDVPSCVKLMNDIEASSRLKLTGIISNTHLMTETTPETVLEGLELSRAVSKQTGKPIVFLSAERGILEKIDPRAVDVPVLELHRMLLKPWERQEG